MLVQTEHKNFTRTNLEQFFSALEEPNMSLMVEDTRPLIAGLKPPGVEVSILIRAANGPYYLLLDESGYYRFHI